MEIAGRACGPWWSVEWLLPCSALPYSGVDAGRLPTRLSFVSALAHPAGLSRAQSAFRLSPLYLVIAAALLFSPWPARAATPDDDYLKIFDQIQQADKLIAGAKTNAALAKYQEAQNALYAFRKAHPDLLVSTIKFRLNYVADRIATLTLKAPPAEPSALPGTNAAAKASSAQNVSLLEAGAEPRQILRIHPKPGDKQTITLTTKSDTEVNMPGAANQSSKMPTLKLTMAATVKSTSPEGDITYDFVYEDATLAEDTDTPPQLADVLKPILATLKGLSGTGTMTSRGTQTVQHQLPAGGDPTTSQAVEQLGHSFSGLECVFPEEPVGLGAKWRSQRSSRSQGIIIDQTTTSELVSVDGDRVSVKGTVTQQAAKQKVQNPSLPGGALDLSKMTGNGMLEFTFDLTQLYPSELTGETHVDTTMEMDMADQKQSISTTTTSKVRLEAK
jgi:hypothetical protein